MKTGSSNIFGPHVSEYHAPPAMSGYIKRLFALSSLEFCLLSELVMFMLAHLLLAPFLDVSHSSTSS